MDRTAARLSILSVNADLSGPAAVVGPILAAYRRFVRSAAEDRAPDVRLELRDADPPVLLVGGRPERLAAGVDPTQQVYRRFLTLVFERVADRAVLHAAGLVTPAGDGLILAGPSSHGKTRLALTLVERGFTLLGDDHAPLDLDSGLLEPFPRAVALRSGSPESLPEPLRKVVADPATPHLLGKALIDPEAIWGPQALADGPAPLRHVFVLAAEHHAPSAEARLSITMSARAEAAPRIQEKLAGLSGVEVSGPVRAGDIVAWQVRVAPTARVSEALGTLLADPAVVHSETRRGLAPEFRGPTSAEPIRRREAATVLARELQNRAPGSRLLRRHGDPARLFVDLAHALRAARCWRVRPGGVAATVALLEGKVREKRSAEPSAD